MATPLETIDAATAKLDTLISATAEPAAEKVVEMKPADAIKAIAAELAEPEKLSKERIEYLTTTLAEITKAENNYEASGTLSSITIRVVEDKDRRAKPTRTFTDLTKLPTSGTPTGSIFASNATLTSKAEEIAKLLVDRDALKKFMESEAIAKSEATDKMAEIISLFGLSDADLKDTYEVRWKIGDLISLLQNQIRLERMLAGGNAETVEAAAKTTKAAGPEEWPTDMASAKYDPARKAYEKAPSRWSDDK